MVPLPTEAGSAITRYDYGHVHSHIHDIFTELNAVKLIGRKSDFHKLYGKQPI